MALLLCGRNKTVPIRVWFVFFYIAGLVFNTGRMILQVSTRDPPDSLDIRCRELVQNITHLQHPWEFNQLRRAVALKYPMCFENTLFPLFARVFNKSRIGLKQQYNLHIPKTAGSSLCLLARRSNFKVPPANCNPVELGPYWCCDHAHPRPMSCESVVNSRIQFVGNERWLDHDESLFCDDMTYSITIREPVTRAMSQTTVYLDLFAGSGSTTAKTKRLNIIQNNYITWSLVSGISDNPTKFQVKNEHLPLAKDMLSRFDYIVDVGGDEMSEECLAAMLEFMGMSRSKLPHEKKTKTANYTAFYNEQTYRALNAIDLKLYQYAQELLRVDCAFFQRMKEQAI